MPQGQATISTFHVQEQPDPRAQAPTQPHQRVDDGEDTVGEGKHPLLPDF